MHVVGKGTGDGRQVDAGWPHLLLEAFMGHGRRCPKRRQGLVLPAGDCGDEKGFEF